MNKTSPKSKIAIIGSGFFGLTLAESGNQVIIFECANKIENQTIKEI